MQTTCTNLDARRPDSRWLWVFAASGSVALHAAFVALVAVSLRDDPDDVALGAPAIQIDIVLTAPTASPNDLPPGPDVESAVASPANVPERKQDKPSEQLKVEVAESSDPDGLAAPDIRESKNTDNTASHASPSDPSVAALATAIPHPDSAEVASASAAPASGTGDSALRIRAIWEKELAAHLDKYKRYPSDRSHQAAELVVTFDLDRTGRILSTRIVQGSGDASFDEAGLAMLRRADPVPAPPASVADAGLTFTMPIIFRFHGRS